MSPRDESALRPPGPFPFAYAGIRVFIRHSEGPGVRRTGSMSMPLPKLSTVPAFHLRGQGSCGLPPAFRGHNEVKHSHQGITSNARAGPHVGGQNAPARRLGFAHPDGSWGKKRSLPSRLQCLFSVHVPCSLALHVSSRTRGREKRPRERLPRAEASQARPSPPPAPTPPPFLTPGGQVQRLCHQADPSVGGLPPGLLRAPSPLTARLAQGWG